MRVAGGQEIGMACDFSLAGDHATFGQAGPIHGSAPDGGSTDFLDLYVGYARAAESLALCEQWTAYEALRHGLVNDVAPVFRNGDGQLVPNPTLVTDRWVGDDGRIVYGQRKTGVALEEGRKRAAGCTIDLSALDALVDRYATRLLHTFPDCTRKTLESLRKKKLQHWLANCETNRSWLSLNMNAEARAGFPAFHFGARGEREVDFVALRRAVAEGRAFDGQLVREVLPPSARQALAAAAEPEAELVGTGGGVP
jgi:6-oxo-cyclohex-1-ene-carbonyl-CoA hydrolase